jgi:formylglycine-generating enzyme
MRCCTPERSAAAATEARKQLPQRAGAPSRDMTLIPAGRFLIGSDDGEAYPEDGEGPVREVELPAFWIDTCAVTNAEFSEFVRATGYRTEAESYGSSFVFHAFVPAEREQWVLGEVEAAPWWRAVRGASWRHPEGPWSTIGGRQDHPVVHVSWNDAVAYCAWSGTELPTEEQWEAAARGGPEQERYPWGRELCPEGRWRCNIWQGTFPTHNTAEDGHLGTAPVRTYEPNAFGLYQMVGNVWEWCASQWSTEAMVIRGGSYLCHESYCYRYRVAARTSNTRNSSTGNIGFRCVRSSTERATS